jgi:hypothetical protein
LEWGTYLGDGRVSVHGHDKKIALKQALRALRCRTAMWRIDV